MKYTSILLMTVSLLSMTAYGAITVPYTVESLTEGNLQITPGTTSNTSWAVSFNMEISPDFSLENALPVYSANYSGANPTGNVFYLTGFDHGECTFAAEKPLPNPASSWFTNVTLTLDGSPLTLIYRQALSGGGSTISLYQGTQLIMSGTNTASLFPLNNNLSTLWTNNGDIQYSNIQVSYFDKDPGIDSDMSILSALNIPEPATASMGLLGLAALAMRRRRF